MQLCDGDGVPGSTPCRSSAIHIGRLSSSGRQPAAIRILPRRAFACLPHDASSLLQALVAHAGGLQSVIRPNADSGNCSNLLSLSTLYLQAPARAGCDALAVYLIIAMIGGTLDVGPGALGVVGTLAIMIPWIGAQWEEYHSGLMLYGNGVIGITEVSDRVPSNSHSYIDSITT